MSRSTNSDAINGVRQRYTRTPRTDILLENEFSEPDKYIHSSRSFQPKTITLFTLFLVFVIYAALFALQIYLERFHHPRPLLLTDLPNHPHEFISERAMNRLVKLTSIGPRVAGSYENEVLAVKFLKREIEKIMANAHPAHRIELDIQKYNGSFPLRFLDGLTNVYVNVQDVVVKLGSERSSPNSVLMNCHFDSVPDSPGASDDGAGCAVLLEILDVLSRSPTPLDHSIIFLFNGAEENLMHGSHGFITQHPWAKEVRAFVNLEACGAGGREVLFQSGPNSPWIMEVYAKSVLHPFASSMAQEVFESGLIPGDTDFRVFRDFGNISGLDFAWSTNGYVYHTKFDNVNQIPLGAIQRTGENMLALAKGLASAREMYNVAEHRQGNMIYFDLLGLYLVRWPEHVGTVLNISTVVLSVALLAVSVVDARKKGVGPGLYLVYLAKTFGVVFLGAALSVLIVLIIALVLTMLQKTMSWYGQPTWLLFLYIIPSTVSVMVTQRFFSQRFLSVIPSRMLIFQLYFDVYQICWTTVLLASVILRIRSGYIAWMWVFAPCLGMLIHRSFKSPLQRSPDWKWLLFLLSSVSLPVVQHINMQVGCLALFIPIMGRSGASLNSEIVIALFTNVTFGMLFAHITPLVVLLRSPKKAFVNLCFLSLAAFVLLFTPLGFPYSGDELAPRPQRYMILQTERIYYNVDGEIMDTSYGFWVVNHDYNSPHYVIKDVPELSSAEEIELECDLYLYCGLPYLMPVLSFIKKTHWIPRDYIYIDKPTSLTVLSREVVTEAVERITLKIQGPDHMGLIISPRKDVEFLRWSLNEDGPVKGPMWKGQETYFVYYASSSDPKSWIVSIDFQVSAYNETLMDLVLTSHFLHGPQKTEFSFQSFLAQFPSWTAVTAWTASYKSFIL